MDLPSFDGQTSASPASDGESGLKRAIMNALHFGRTIDAGVATRDAIRKGTGRLIERRVMVSVVEALLNTPDLMSEALPVEIAGYLLGSLTGSEKARLYNLAIRRGKADTALIFA